MAQKIILDCDPGHDDAVAIMMAAKHPEIELLGITTVRGNQTLEKVTRNALNVVQYLDIDVPVYKGMSVPMVIEPRPVEERVHGDSGLDGPQFDELTRTIESKHAIQFIIETRRRHHTGANRSADQHRYGYAHRTAHRAEDQADRADGRLLPAWQRDSFC